MKRHWIQYRRCSTKMKMFVHCSMYRVFNLCRATVTVHRVPLYRRPKLLPIHQVLSQPMYLREIRQWSQQPIQLIFQILYASVNGLSNSNTVRFAFVASLLSVIASVLTYFINRDDNKIEMELVQYRLALECDRTLSATPSSAVPVAGMMVEAPNNDIVDEEDKKIRKYRGLRKKLSRSLTGFWNSLVSLP